MNDSAKTVISSEFLVKEPPVISSAKEQEQNEEESEWQILNRKVNQLTRELIAKSTSLEELEKKLAESTRENRHLKGRILGYETLSK